MVQSDILLVEVVRAGKGTAARWRQVHLTHDNAAFFGLPPKARQPVTLTPVDNHGSKGAPENRKFVLSSSNKNLKIEIGALKDHREPMGAERPIVAFHATDTGTADYTILMPGDTEYPAVNGWLQKQPRKAKQRARAITPPADLRKLWASFPL